jgi:hypothetical protein
MFNPNLGAKVEISPRNFTLEVKAELFFNSICPKYQ